MSNIKQIPSFQTTDGKLFASRPEALTHQLMVDARGLMQSNSLGKLGNPSVTDMATFVAAHADELYPLLQKYREKMRRIAA